MARPLLTLGTPHPAPVQAKVQAKVFEKSHILVMPCRPVAMLI